MTAKKNAKRQKLRVVWGKRPQNAPENWLQHSYLSSSPVSAFLGTGLITNLKEQQKKIMSIQIIVSVATGQIQPDDACFFSYIKSLMKRFHSLVNDLPFDL